jgi:hypothetical protein
VVGLRKRERKSLVLRGRKEGTKEGRTEGSGKDCSSALEKEMDFDPIYLLFTNGI